MDSGLENVVAAETVLSDVDGKAGRLVIRGWAVEDLAASKRYEDVIGLLWGGFFEGIRADIQGRLGAARVAAFRHVGQFPTFGVVESLRTGWTLLDDDETPGTALALAGSAAVFTAAAVRARRGLAPIAPDPALSQSEDILSMMRGAAPAPAEARALDAYLATVSDHGLNASTFAARVIASTRAGLGSAAIGGLSALKGPLHGGAPGPVLDMLDDIGAPDAAEAWIDAALARKERLMGFGHRVYRVRDPRADALKTAVKRLPGTAGRIAFAEHIEKTVLQSLRRKYPDRGTQSRRPCCLSSSTSKGTSPFSKI